MRVVIKNLVLVRRHFPISITRRTGNALRGCAFAFKVQPGFFLHGNCNNLANRALQVCRYGAEASRPIHVNILRAPQKLAEQAAAREAGFGTGEAGGKAGEQKINLVISFKGDAGKILGVVEAMEGVSGATIRQESQV